MIRKIYDRLASLTFGLWLMGGVILLLAVGSFTGGGAEGSSINDVPLFAWLGSAPPAQSWWLWGTVGLLALLALNTGLCSIESLRLKYQRDAFLRLIAPQVMHLGFLLIVLAHLASAYGSFKGAGAVMEGQTISLPGGGKVQVTDIRAEPGPMGMPSDYSAVAAMWEAEGVRTATMRPNHPVFYRGFGIYLKQVELVPVRGAFIEVHREPGARLALGGALLFTVGNVVLLAVRRGRQDT
jgi:hypothetical protein